MTLGTIGLGTIPEGYQATLRTEIPGEIQLIMTSSTLTLTMPPRSGDEFILESAGGIPDASYRILTTTNLAAPLSSWIPVVTHQFDAKRQFYFTNLFMPQSGQQFFLLQSP